LLHIINLLLLKLFNYILIIIT